jgi:hypothetical protein
VPSSSETRTLLSPPPVQVGGQSLSLPDVTGGLGSAFSSSSPMTKLIVGFAILALGLALMGRWTGHYIGVVNLLGPNGIGGQINAAQQRLGQPAGPSSVGSPVPVVNAGTGSTGTQRQGGPFP